MSISELEVAVILAERSKRIDSDVVWEDRPGRATGKVFRVDVGSEPDWELFIDGFWNPESGKLTYNLVHARRERIIGLHLGAAHQNPKGDLVGDTHKHHWTDLYKEDDAYEPSDITADWDKPVEVWRQFCAEVVITHHGQMHEPEWQRERIL